MEKKKRKLGIGCYKAENVIKNMYMAPTVVTGINICEEIDILKNDTIDV